MADPTAADPFARALAILLNAAGSVAIDYTARGGARTPLRALRGQAEDVIHTSHGGGLIPGGNTFVLARSDVPLRPRKGDQIDLAGETFTAIADATLDAEGTGWMVRTD